MRTRIACLVLVGFLAGACAPAPGASKRDTNATRTAALRAVRLGLPQARETTQEDRISGTAGSQTRRSDAWTRGSGVDLVRWDWSEIVGGPPLGVAELVLMQANLHQKALAEAGMVPVRG